MNIFQKVTWATLKKNKTRTIVTIIGIMLSTALFTAVTTSITSLQQFLLKNIEYQVGAWHANAASITKSKMDELTADDRMKDYTFTQELGYADVGASNPEKPYLYVIGAEEDMTKLLPVYLTAGNFPKNDQEILLPEHLATNGQVVHKLGDKMTIGLGDRIQEGAVLHQNTPFQSEWKASPDEPMGQQVLEALKVREERTYTVVGFYERPGFEPRSAPGYTAITGRDEKPADSALYDLYYRMNDIGDIDRFDEDHKITALINAEYLMFNGYSRYGNFYTMLYGLAAIIIILVLLGSISLIYNAFSISVSERTKQFGLLSSIGATKKQLQRTVFSEAGLLSVIGIPLGILLGLVGMWVTFFFIGDRFDLGSEIGVRMSLHASPISLAIASVLAIFTIFLSAWIPSKRATKITAIEAIRMNKDIKAVAPKRVSKLTYKLFGLPAVLASKYFRNSKKKYRTTVFSLFVSIVLFVSASSFVSTVTGSTSAAFSSSPYDINWITSSHVVNLPSDQILSITDEDADVTETALEQMGSSYVLLEENQLAPLAKENIIDPMASEQVAADPMDVGGFRPEKRAIPQQNNSITFVDDEAFRGYLKKLGLDEAKHMDPLNPIPLVYSTYSYFNLKEQKVLTGDVIDKNVRELRIRYGKPVDNYHWDGSIGTNTNGKEVIMYRSAVDLSPKEFSRSEYLVEETIPVGGVLTRDDVSLMGIGNLQMIYPKQAMATIEKGRDINTSVLLVRTKDHTATFKKMSAEILNRGLPVDSLNNYAKVVEGNRNIVLIFNVFAYGFIILISLISIANVFNTISTNLQLRRRDIAMLRSTGMDSKGINRMVSYECMLFGTKALLFGIPISLLFSYAIYKATFSGVSVTYQLPLIPILIATVTIFIVVFVTMMYAVRKMKKENPIEALQAENL